MLESRLSTGLPRLVNIPPHFLNRLKGLGRMSLDVAELPRGLKRMLWPRAGKGKLWYTTNELSDLSSSLDDELKTAFGTSP